jgi:tRNA pseudouridine55 synthase
MVLSPALPLPAELPKGFVLLIDKPLGWSSFDVVNKVRFHLKKRLAQKNLKVGHAGTLDPLATGLLIICVGIETKNIDTYQGLSKTYSGRITFGATTPSYDLEKPTENHREAVLLDDAAVAAALGQFRGRVPQIPPAFSAIKVDGKAMYKNARTGQVLEMEPRLVQVDVFEVSPLHAVQDAARAHRLVSEKGAQIHQYPEYAAGQQLDFHIVCSKGTYIRSLAHDLGQALGVGAYLSALRREAIGEFQVQDAWELDTLVALIKTEHSF